MVEPTHLNNMLVKLDHETPIFGMNIKHVEETTRNAKHSMQMMQKNLREHLHKFLKLALFTNSLFMVGDVPKTQAIRSSLPFMGGQPYPLRKSRPYEQALLTIGFP